MTCAHLHLSIIWVFSSDSPEYISANTFLKITNTFLLIKITKLFLKLWMLDDKMREPPGKCSQSNLTVLLKPGSRKRK